MELIYLGCILLLRVVQNIAKKANSNLAPTTPRGVSVYLSLMNGFSAGFALILLLLSGNIIASIAGLPALGWIISCATGATLTISTLCSLFALKGSSIVLGSLFGMAGLIIPTIFGIFIYNQSVSWLQWFGIALLFVAAVLLASSSKKTNGKLTIKTVLLLFLSMLANGFTMLLQTLYKNFLPSADVTLYTFFQFFIPSIVMLLVFFIMSIPKARANLDVAQQKEENSIKFSKKLIFFMLLSAVSIFGISQISTIASAIIPVAVLFPISDGGAVIIAAIVAAVIYKEKITWKSALGIVIGIIAVCIMKFC